MYHTFFASKIFVFHLTLSQAAVPAHPDHLLDSRRLSWLGGSCCSSHFLWQQTSWDERSGLWMFTAKESRSFRPHHIAHWKFTLANRSQGRRFIADIALHRSFKKGNLSSKLWSGAEWWHPSTFAGIVNQALSNLDSDDSNLHSHKWLHSHPVQNIYSTYRILALLIRRSQCAKLILARTGKTHPFHPQIIAGRKFRGKCAGLCLGLALAYHTSSHQLPPSFTLSKKRVVIGPCPVPWHCPPSKFLVGKRHGDRDVELRLDAMLNKTWWLHTAPFTAASRSVPLCSNPAAQKRRPCQDMFVLPMQVSGASQQC